MMLYIFTFFFFCVFFFFNDTATTEIYTLSLHDALPIFLLRRRRRALALVDHDLVDVLVADRVGRLLPRRVLGQHDLLSRGVGRDLVRPVRDRVLLELRAVRQVVVVLGGRGVGEAQRRDDVEEVARGLDQLDDQRGRVRRGNARDVVAVLEGCQLGRRGVH